MNLWEREISEILKNQLGNRDENNPFRADMLNKTVKDFLKIFYANDAYVRAVASSYFSNEDFIDFNHNGNSYGVNYLANLNGEQKLIVVINNDEGFIIDTFRGEGRKSFKPRYYKRDTDISNVTTLFGDKALDEIERIKKDFIASNS